MMPAMRQLIHVPGAEAAAARNVRLYYAFNVLMDFGLWMGIWIKYLTVSRGLELKWILIMDVPFWLAVAALEAPFGALADRIGRKRVLALGGAAMSLTILGFGFTTNYWLLFADYMLWAVAMALRSGADQALIYDSLKDAGRESTFAKVVGRGFSFMLGSTLAGILLGGVLATQTSLAFTVQVSMVGPALAAVAALMMVEPAMVKTGRSYVSELMRGVRFTWGTPQIRYTVLLGSLLMIAGFLPVFLTQPFLIEHDVATGLFGVYQAPVRLLAVAAAAVAFRAAAIRGPGGLFSAAILSVVAAYLGLALFDATWAFVFFAVPSVFQGLVRPTVDAYVNHRTPSDMRATVLSAGSLVLSVQMAFVEPVVGFLMDDVSFGAAALFLAVFFGVTAPPLLVLWRRADRDSAGRPDVAAEPVPAAIA